MKRFGMRSGLLTAALLALIGSGPAAAADNLVLGKKLLVKDPTGAEDKRLVLIIGKERTTDVSFSNIPVPTSASLRVILNGANASDTTYPLGAPGTWTFAGPGLSGVLKYTGGDPVKLVLLKQSGSGAFTLKAKLTGRAGPASLDHLPPNPGSDGGIIVTIDQGFGPQVFATKLGGTAGGTPSANDATQWKVANAIAQPGPPVAGGSTTSSTSSTSSTTSTTMGGPCCNGHSFFNFTSNSMAGDCGDIIDADGALDANINCGGYYIGGGSHTEPLPFAAPDLTSPVMAITSCTGQTATVGATTSTQTGGSNKNCSSAGCLFGAPIPVPQPSVTGFSGCLTNIVMTAPSGNLDCSTGAANLNVGLGTILFFFTGDITYDPSGTIPGIQSCPICSSGSCIGGPNNGMACVPGTTAINGSYPTSNDCPPDPMFNRGTLPISFALSSGTVFWTGTIATNDTGFSGSDINQRRVFSGFCRDRNGTGCFKGQPDTACPVSTPGFQQCWENGMAVGPACVGTFESCEQRNHGFFGPGGGFHKTITAIGSGDSLIGGPAAMTLASIFSMPPSFEASVDATEDIPGPGAVTLPGTARTCAAANPCP